MMNNDRVYYSRDAETHAKREMTAVTTLALALGLGIGAIAALLFAASSGKKTRQDLARSMEKGWEDGRDAVAPVVKRFEENLGELRNNVEERISQLT
jgi:gas vesicle protein